MTHPNQTADLRKWWRQKLTDRPETVWGYVHNDPNDFWDDGELGEFEVKSLVDCGNFYILHTAGKTIFKLEKDEEKQRQNKAF